MHVPAHVATPPAAVSQSKAPVASPASTPPPVVVTRAQTPEADTYQPRQEDEYPRYYNAQALDPSGQWRHLSCYQMSADSTPSCRYTD